MMSLRIYLKDPSAKNQTDGMKTLAVLFVQLSQPYNELRKNRGIPTSQAINSAIVCVTNDWRIAQAWCKEPPPSMACCARCGAGLLTYGCQQCGIKARFTGNISFDENPPALPQKVVDFLVRQGHVFVTDPAEAQRRGAAR